MKEVELQKCCMVKRRVPQEVHMNMNKRVQNLKKKRLAIALKNEVVPPRQNVISCIVCEYRIRSIENLIYSV